MADRKPAGHLIIPILVFLITELVVTLIIAYATGEGWLPDAEMSNIATSVSAIANLMVLFFCERKMGLGTLIMGIRDEAACRKVFGVPEEETIMAVIAVGYPAQEPPRRPRKTAEEILKIF